VIDRTPIRLPRPGAWQCIETEEMDEIMLPAGRAWGAPDLVFGDGDDDDE
jgi:hypothetical protein